jgi:hypothetical protein
MRMLTREDVPCWHEFSHIQSPSPTIVIRVHKGFVARHILSSKAPIIESIRRELGLQSEFQPRLDADFGFSGNLKFKHQAEFNEFHLALPRIYTVYDRPCQMCQGSGQDELLDRECLFCRGFKKDSGYDYTQAYELCGSLQILLQFLQLVDVETTSSQSQLMLVETVCRRGSNAIGGTFARPLARWFVAGGPRNLVRMVETMQSAWSHMMQPRSESLDHRQFRASITYGDGALHVDCPGDACGLNPHHLGIRPQEGYRFSDHNVDSPAQQLTLLAGLAALHDQAREEIG